MIEVLLIGIAVGALLVIGAILITFGLIAVVEWILEVDVG